MGKTVRRKQRLIRYFAVLISVIFCLQTVGNSYSLSNQTEIRGAWLTNVDSEILFSTEGVENALARLKRLNFNTVYPTVWQGGYSLYPSEVSNALFGESIHPQLSQRRGDMLEEVISRGHQLGMTVISWFEFGFMLPVDSPLAQQHPDWLTERQDGTTVEMKGEDPVVWLNPFHSKVQDLILDLITEIITQYDVDGIQLDDHFGLPSMFGYDDYTTRLYKEDRNVMPPADARDTFWVHWRADRLTEFMERLFLRVKSVKPDCIISLSPNPLHFAVPAHVQDWLTCEQNGYLDELVLQIYRTDMERFTDELERTEVQLVNSDIPVAIGILSGLKNRPTPIALVEKQVKEVRDRGFNGVSFFFYESIWKWGEKSPAEREKSIYNLFAFQATRQ